MFNLYSLTAQNGYIIGSINETIDSAKDEISAVEKFIGSYWFSALKAAFFSDNRIYCRKNTLSYTEKSSCALFG